MKRTSIFLSAEDKEAIEIIKRRYGLSTDSDAVRLAVRVVAEAPRLIIDQTDGDRDGAE